MRSFELTQNAGDALAKRGISMKPRFRFVELGYRSGEDVYSGMGPTDAGRYLIVFFIQKPNSAALILSARDMDSKERRLYERNR
jgi:uncharacterized protein